jgi:uncharacterized protein
MKISFHNFANSHRRVFGFLLSLLIVALLGLVGVVIANQLKAGQYISEGEITVSGLGERYVQPDLALVNFTVTTEEKTVRQAMEENAEDMNNVIQAIDDLGIAKKDIQTTNFNLSPRYEWHRDEEEKEIYSSGERVLVSYEVTQTLQVKVRDLSEIGEVIDGATSAGANQVNRFELTVEHPEEIREEIRLQAVEKAKESAKELASQLGSHLGKLIEVRFNSEIPPLVWEKNLYADFEVAMGGGGAPEPQIETGENLIQETAYLTYKIN